MKKQFEKMTDEEKRKFIAKEIAKAEAKLQELLKISRQLSYDLQKKGRQ